MARPPALVPERIRALVFDLDGTLVDSYLALTLALNHVRARHALAPLGEQAVRAAVGHGVEDLVARTVGADKVEEGVRAFRAAYADALSSGTRALPGVPETLRTLRARGYPLAVASNKASDFTERILRELDLLPLLDAWMGPEQAGSLKPDPAMLRCCLGRLGVDATQAAYVGDMALDVESAARAGVSVILVPGGSSTVEELRRTGERVLGEIGELTSLLPSRPGTSVRGA